MKINEIMTKSVTFINLETSLQEAAEKMAAEDLGSLPVVDPASEKIKGMLTDRDIVVRAVARGKDPSKTSAREAMTEKIRYVFDDDELSVAAEHMKDKQIRRLVVLNRDKRLVGFVSLSDLACKGLDEHLSADVMKSVGEAGSESAA